MWHLADVSTEKLAGICVSECTCLRYFKNHNWQMGEVLSFFISSKDFRKAPSLTLEPPLRWSLSWVWPALHSYGGQPVPGHGQRFDKSPTGWGEQLPGLHPHRPSCPGHRDCQVRIKPYEYMYVHLCVCQTEMQIQCSMLNTAFRLVNTYSMLNCICQRELICRWQQCHLRTQ